MLRFLLLLHSLVLIAVAAAQTKKPLDHTVYDGWKSISSTAIAPNGTFITYEINPQEGDGQLFIFKKDTEEYRSFERGKNAKISPTSEYVLFKIEPQHDTIRKLKIAKKKKDEFPKDSLAVHLVNANTTQKTPMVVSYALPKDSGLFMAYLVEEKRTPPAVPEKKCFFKKKKTETPAPKPEKLNVLHFYNPLQAESKFSIDYVTEYTWSDNGKTLATIAQKKNKEKEPDSCFVSVFNTLTGQTTLLYAALGTAKNITTDRAGEQLAFQFSADTTERKLYGLYYWTHKDTALQLLADTASIQLVAQNWAVSEHRKPFFSHNGSRLFFGVGAKPPVKEKDTIPEEEKVKLDIWHWMDGQIQPEQLKKLKEEKKRNYLAMYSPANKDFITLANEEMEEVTLPFYSDSNFALGRSTKPYERLVTWEGWNTDYYRVNLLNGERTLLLKKYAYRPYLSPNGSYLVYFKDSLWHSIDMASGVSTNISKGIPFALFDEDNDVPSKAWPYGFGGFLNASLHVLVNDRYDVWLLSLKGDTPPVNLTNGRNEKWQYRSKSLNEKDPYIRTDERLYLTAQNEATKNLRVAYLENPSLPVLKTVSEKPEQFIQLSKAENADAVIYRASTFTTYPEIQLTNLDFAAPKIVTHTNPQQEEYRWGNVQLIEWKSLNGEMLQGLLYTPENLAEGEKTPLLVYYYERNSQNLHRHYTPAPSASIINPAEYVSRGYTVLIPDITYKTGEPAQSAYHSILSGTDYVLKNYSFVDEKRMGLQGQSWGGYQTAMLVTMTNRYAAAMAGAPVSNMTSAYGGVRWESGISRMFQYERGQSRLGETIWENRNLFIRNSPLFYLDEVTTPLLIMHNDEDGAVPWYQGIELYMGLRRLEKPAWMLNYNGEAHNLMKRHNRKDLSIRMQQFFDHYLMGKDMPEWMSAGRPAIDKETKTAY
jgi:dipeptidyl aminopeptidase/acylaminoacyl peptidase